MSDVYMAGGANIVFDMVNNDEKLTQVAVLDNSYLEATGIDRILQSADFDVKTEHFFKVDALMDRIEETKFKVLFVDTTSLNGELEEITRHIKAKQSELCIIWLSPGEDELLAFDAINAHADGCVSKLDFPAIVRAVEDASAGEILFSKELLLDFSRRASVLFSKSGRQLAVLTARERQVLELLRQGAKNKDIAEELYISVETVKIHVKNIRKKLGVASRRQLLDGIPSRARESAGRAVDQLM
jgi:two-component system nitrate/nitrite response regulator NarL